MGLVDTTTFVYQFIFDKYDSKDTKMIQYFVMHGLGLCIKLNSYVENMFYACNSVKIIQYQLLLSTTNTTFL